MIFFTDYLRVNYFLLLHLDTNRNCWWRLLCVKKTSQKTFFVALVVLLLTIIGFLTVFGVLMIRQSN